jgi:voltage-gated potassium channel
MAGANKVIDLYEVSANRIHNLLKRPVSTRFLDRILSDNNGFNFREIEIPDGSFLHGMMVEDVNFHACRVLLIGLVDLERGEHFKFITSGDEYTLDSGDRIVCLGMDEDLDYFEAMIKKSEETTCIWPS